MASYPTPRGRRDRHRSPGEGSVYESPDGGWRGAITWTDDDGRRRRRVIRARTSAAARAALDELRDQLRRGSLDPSGAGTVAEFLTGWLEREKQRIRPSTWRGRELHVRAYLVPALGRRRLDKLTPAHVEAMTAGLVGRGLSARSAAHVRVTLRRALADAQRDGLVHRNVAALARPPRVTSRTIEPGRDYLVVGDLRRLLAVAAEYRVGALVTLAATTGLRQGELLGLAWADVDLEAGRLTVRRSLARAWGGGTELAEPKTPRSRRTIHLSAPAIEALRREQREQTAEREVAGTAWQDVDGLVFTDRLGRPLYATAVHRAYRELLVAAGLPLVPFHGLRHSTATALLSAGVPLRVVSDLLGHSGLAITADYYAHVEVAQRREAADAMDRALGGES